MTGNLAPDGAIVKQVAVADEMLKHAGSTRIFSSEELIMGSPMLEWPIMANACIAMASLEQKRVFTKSRWSIKDSDSISPL